MDDIKFGEKRKVFKMDTLERGYSSIMDYLKSRISITSMFIIDIHAMLMLENAKTKTASKISLLKRTFNSTFDEFLNWFPIRIIKEIREVEEPRYAVILASILCLEMENSRFYMSYRKCNKKVVTRSEVVDLDAAEGDEVPVAKPNEMWCKTCKTNPQFVIPRKLAFKVEVADIERE
nr:hypothetical protein [Tanacetum cinerariifolium]